MSGYYKHGRMPAWLLMRYARQPKKYARNAVRVSLDNGTLVRPERCERADGTCKGRLQAHHHSYAPAHWLDVEWLCASHHTREHRKPVVRVELTTARLQIGCSATELNRQTNTNGNEVATEQHAA